MGAVLNGSFLPECIQPRTQCQGEGSGSDAQGDSCSGEPDGQRAAKPLTSLINSGDCDWPRPPNSSRQPFEETLTYYRFQDTHWVRIRTNNPVEKGHQGNPAPNAVRRYKLVIRSVSAGARFVTNLHGCIVLSNLGKEPPDRGTGVNYITPETYLARLLFPDWNRNSNRFLVNIQVGIGIISTLSFHSWPPLLRRKRPASKRSYHLALLRHVPKRVATS